MTKLLKRLDFVYKLPKLIGAITNIIRLSGDTMAKQRGEMPGNPGHPELTTDEYRLLPETLSEGEDFPSKWGPVSRARIREIGGIRYIAIVKSADRGREMYLTSFRRMSDRDYQVVVKRSMAAAEVDCAF